MAGTELATAYLSLVPSMGGIQGKIAQELAGVDTGGLGKGMGSKLGGGLAGSFKAIAGPAIALVAGGAIKDFAVGAVASFSELEDSTAAAGVVFGKNMDQIITQSESAGSTLGLSQQQVINAANTFGTYGKAAGLSGKELANFATEQTALAADMASFKGTSPEQAIEAIGAALRGETEPIRAYGVMLDDASLKQEAMAQGIISTTKDALTPQQKTLAAQSLILKQTKDAQGDFARTSTSTANVAKTLAAESENLSAKIGKSLAPAFTTVRLAALAGVRGMSGALDTIGPKIDYVSNLVISGAGLIKEVLTTGNISGKFLEDLGIEEDSPFIGGLFTARETIQTVLFNIQQFVAGFTIPWDTLAGAGVEFSGAVAFGASVREVFEHIGAALGPLVPQFLDLFRAVSPVQLIFQTIQPFLVPLVGLLGQMAAVLGDTLGSALGAILPALTQLSTMAVTLFQGVLAMVLPVAVQLLSMLAGTMQTLTPIITAVITVVMGLAMQLLASLMPIIMQLVASVLPMVVSIFGSVLSAIGPVIQIIAGLLIPIIQALMPVVVTVFGVIANVIRAAMQIVQGIIQVVTGIITGNWRMVFTGLWNIVSGAFQLVVSLVSGGMATAWSLVSAGLGLIGGFFRSVFNGVVSFLGGVWGNITRGVSGMIGNVVGFFSGLIGKITGAIGNAGSALWNTGVSIIQGLIDGIGSMMGAIGRAVLNIVPQAIRGPFEDLLGIHSPSRVFRAYGVNIGQGLVLGVADMYGDVQDAVEGLAPTPPEVPAFVGQARGTGAASVAYHPAYGSGSGEPTLVQNVYPQPGQSEETISELSARKIMRAGVR